MKILLENKAEEKHLRFVGSEFRNNIIRYVEDMMRAYSHTTPKGRIVFDGGANFARDIGDHLDRLLLDSKNIVYQIKE